ncbi:hypothetical protein KEJ50_05225 [Candidatus Bathyarchaeota archaeon]|nr:hypothetical protein [Candidatus Bathyarchaeota archaeon]
MELIKLLFKEECDLTKGLKKGEITSFGEMEIAYIQPCASERGKVTADIVMSREDKTFFDFTMVCLILELYKIMFAEEKCNQVLGAAMIKWRGRDIIVFRNGRISVKRALSKDEVKKILASLNRLLWGSVLCNNCGKPLVDCAFGKCKKCMNAKEFKIDLSYFKKALTGLFLVKSLKKLYEASGKTLNYSIDLTVFDKPKLIDVYQSVNEAAREALNCIAGASDVSEACLGLIALSLIINFKASIQNAIELTGYLTKEAILKFLILISKAVLNKEDFKEEKLAFERELNNFKIDYLMLNKVRELMDSLVQLSFIASLFNNVKSLP